MSSVLALTLIACCLLPLIPHILFCRRGQRQLARLAPLAFFLLSFLSTARTGFAPEVTGAERFGFCCLNFLLANLITLLYTGIYLFYQKRCTKI